MVNYDVRFSIKGVETIEAQLGKFQGEILKRVGELDEAERARLEEETHYLVFDAKTSRMIKKAERERQQLESKTLQTVSKVSSMLNRAYSLVQQSLSLMGMGITGMAGATVTLVFSVAGTLLALATSKLTAQDYIGAAMGFAGAAMGFAQQVIAENDRQQIARERREAEAALQNRRTVTSISIML